MNITRNDIYSAEFEQSSYMAGMNEWFLKDTLAHCRLFSATKRLDNNIG